MEGPWERADHTLDRVLEQRRMSRNRFGGTLELRYYGNSSIHAATWHAPGESLEKGAGSASRGGHIICELFNRLELVWVFLDLQTFRKCTFAARTVSRFKASGEGWRGGLAARTARAEGVVAAPAENIPRLRPNSSDRFRPLASTLCCRMKPTLSFIGDVHFCRPVIVTEPPKTRRGDHNLQVVLLCHGIAREIF
jgi:hypothetical protein